MRDVWQDIEKETQKSEAAIRKKLFPDWYKETLPQKIKRSENVVSEFVGVLGLDEVYVSTSGGKDSAALSHLCKELFPEIKHYMFDTGLEYQATLKAAQAQGAEIIRPCTGWKKFCDAKGYPVGSKQVSKRIHDARISPIGCAITFFSGPYHLSHKWLHFLDTDIPISHRCCDEFKKKPARRLKLSPIIGTRVTESAERKNAWKKTGCNTYTGKHGVSRPISLWSDENIADYIDEEDIELSEIYTQYQAKRTGCVCCPYGAHLEERSRFDLLRKLEPARYELFMKTPLREILLKSGVMIDSDPKYMRDLMTVSKETALIHRKMAGADNYFSWMCAWAVKRHGLNSMKQAVQHIHEQSGGKLTHPLETILMGLETAAQGDSDGHK